MSKLLLVRKGEDTPTCLFDANLEVCGVMDMPVDLSTTCCLWIGNAILLLRQGMSLSDGVECCLKDAQAILDGMAIKPRDESIRRIQMRQADTYLDAAAALDYINTQFTVSLV